MAAKDTNGVDMSLLLRRSFPFHLPLRVRALRTQKLELGRNYPGAWARMRQLREENAPRRSTLLTRPSLASPRLALHWRHDVIRRTSLPVALVAAHIVTLQGAGTRPSSSRGEPSLRSPVARSPHPCQLTPPPLSSNLSLILRRPVASVDDLLSSSETVSFRYLSFPRGCAVGAIATPR